MPSIVHVMTGVLIDASERVLIAERPPGKHMAGGWEFPGGKLEPGEERRAGLARELEEELGIRIETARLRPLIRVTHQYPTRTVLLDTWVVRDFQGEPRGLDGQALRWCVVGQLGEAGMLPADVPIVRALALPERLRLIATPLYRVDDAKLLSSARASPAPRDDHSPRRGALCEDLADIGAAAAAGAEFIVMRRALKDHEARVLCRQVSLPVYLHATSPEAAWALGATGIVEPSTPRAG